jgi:hypothetical protein
MSAPIKIMPDKAFGPMGDIVDLKYAAILFFEKYN